MALDLDDLEREARADYDPRDEPLTLPMRVAHTVMIELVTRLRRAEAALREIEASLRDTINDDAIGRIIRRALEAPDGS